ncbi:cyclase family protein [Paucibacter sp. R3-3]|uniref:Cyclase family protein n=1 Tax=Roseateles agri TaxID=3098619 RepID=A0ABU5DP17_9BURK|nr:cyclase family protein [Paucibacter sp. R3-3]MDY0748057.1 cyclase family protein [Paucibacter sp. R3-3]
MTQHRENAAANPRWKHRPEGSNWGDFGPDDQRGRLNLLTPERVKRAVAEVHEGLTFCLSLPLDYPGGNLLNPRRHPPVLRPTLRNGRPNLNYRMADDNPYLTDVMNDDAVILHTQYSTQWDALCHVGQLFDADGDGVPEPRYYNGYRPGIDVVGPSDPSDAGAVGLVPYKATSEARALGIENMATSCVQGRGVMVDLHAHVGDAHTYIGYDAFMRILDTDRVQVEPGDMLCLHTGFAEMVLGMNRTPDPERLEHSCAVLDGRDERLLQWVSDSQVAVIAADNYAVEGLPAAAGFGCCAMAPLHELCLFKIGVHLGELWHFTPLARWLRQHGRSRFLLTAPPLRLPGAVGSPATPVATV